MFAEHQRWALQASACSWPARHACAARRACVAPHVAPVPRHNFTTRLEIVVDLISAPLEVPSWCIPYVLGVSHRRDQDRLCRLCANTQASKLFKYQSAVPGAKIFSSLERWADIGGNASSKARGCCMGGGGCWGGAGGTCGIDWSGTWLSSSPPIKPPPSPSPRSSSSGMSSWRSNAHLTNITQKYRHYASSHDLHIYEILRNKTQFTRITQKSNILLLFTQQSLLRSTGEGGLRTSRNNAYFCPISA